MFRRNPHRVVIVALSVATLSVTALVVVQRPTAAFAAVDCGSRFPNQVAAGYPADVKASGVSCHTARIVAATCSAGNHVTNNRCTSQGHTWRLRTRTLYVNGNPTGARTTCTAGRRVVAFTSYGDD